MTDQDAPSRAHRSIAAPLRLPLFRRIWFASLLSNLGFMILSVGAAWTMTTLTSEAKMVALVQTSLMAPMMLLSLAAGAIADMYDRRKVGLAALSVSLLSSSSLAALALAGVLSPWLLLASCFAVGLGMAMFLPSWQASVSEQVPISDLPQAVALNSISFNIARSFGPAIGGVIVAAAGSMAAFGTTALSYIPLFLVMLLWRRVPVPSRLPAERIDRAVSAGIRYALYSHSIRIVLLRTFVLGFAGGSISALMPLVTRDLIGGDAQTYGVMLGATGIGSVLGALNIARLRRWLNTETILILSTITMAACVAVVGLSHSTLLSIIALLGAGMGWMIALTLFNVAVQMTAPRWVTGRALASYQTAIAAGVAIGSWFWGNVAQQSGVSAAMLFSAGALAATLLLGLFWKMPEIREIERDTLEMSDPEISLPLTGRSGPIIVELEFKVAPEHARDFYRRMQEVRTVRLRNGAYGWSIARDIAAPENWYERFHCSTWLDYLRQRNRTTPVELEVYEEAWRYQQGDPAIRIRRLLERPFGSVRWTDETPDSGDVAPPA